MTSTLAAVGRADGSGPDPAVIARVLHRVVSTSGTTFSVWSPITGDQIAEVPESTTDDVAAAYERARAAQVSWAATPVAHRTAIMLKFHDLMLQRRDEALDLVQWETGKARKDAFEELADVCLNARYYARTAAKLLKRKAVRSPLPVVVAAKHHVQPKGVVGIIAPWNYPLTLAVSDAIPALLAGNAVVIKPDSQTTLTALWVIDLLAEAGLPEGLLNVVAGEGARLGPSIVAGADYMMFTGSTATGRLIARQCGEQLIGCTLELGGKNAIIVCADADIDRAVEIAVRASFSNAGQLCESSERIYVDRAMWDEFVPAFLARVRGMRQGVGVGWGWDIGSLISAQQLDRVAAHVDDAVAKGATVLAGGRARPDLGPFVFEPTVLTGVTEAMDVCRNETFGPVVSLYPFDTEEEAVALVNDSAFGLNGSVLTRDTKRGVDIARRIRTGTVNVNEGYAAAWATTSGPLGGMRDSGMGRRHGPEGLLKYTESQTIAVQRVLGWGPPFGLSDEQWAESLTLAMKAMKAARLK